MKLDSVVPASQINLSILQRIFNAGSFRTTIDNDGDLMVITENLSYWVYVNDQAQLIVLLAMMPIPNAPTGQTNYMPLLMDVNHYNIHSPSSVAAVRTQDGLTVVRFLSDINYGGGLLPGNLIARLKRLEKSILSAHRLMRHSMPNR